MALTEIGSSILIQNLEKLYGATEPPWTGATDSPLEGLLSPIQHSKWRGRWWRNGKGMKWLSGGSPVGRKQKPSLMPTEALPLTNLHPQNIRVRDWVRDSDFKIYFKNQ